MRQNKNTWFYIGGSGLDRTDDFEKICRSGLDRIQFYRTGLDSDWKISQSAHLWCLVTYGRHLPVTMCLHAMPSLIPPQGLVSVSWIVGGIIFMKLGLEDLRSRRMRFQVSKPFYQDFERPITTCLFQQFQRLAKSAILDIEK